MLAGEDGLSPICYSKFAELMGSAILPLAAASGNSIPNFKEIENWENDAIFPILKELKVLDCKK